MLHLSRSVILASRFGVNSGYRKFQECIPDRWRIYPNRIDLVDAGSGSGCIPSRIIFTQTTATIITALRQRIIIPRRAFKSQESWHQFVEHAHGRLPLVENDASTADATPAETADLMLENKYSLAQENHLYCVSKKYMKIRLERNMGLLFSGLLLFMLLTFTLTGRPSSITPMLLKYGTLMILLMLGIRFMLVLSAQ